MAVLAAAGSLDAHPLADFSESYRLLRDLGAERFADNLEELNQFFLDTVHGDALNDAVAHEGRIIFGNAGGPWYTVGYRIAVTIEREFGRGRDACRPAPVRGSLQRSRRARKRRGRRPPPRVSAEILKAVGSENR
jgi:hypothetical protein